MGEVPRINLEKQTPPLTHDDISVLADAVAMGNVTSLNLAGNALDDAAIEILVPELKRSRKIEIIDLRDNQITDHGMELLADALANHPSLVKLDMGGNPISAKGVEAMEPVMQSAMLAELYLMPRQFTGLHGVALSDVRKELMKGAPTLAKAAEARGSKNLLNVNPNPDAVPISLMAAMRENANEARFIGNELKRQLGTGWPVSLIAKAAARRGALITQLDPDDILIELDETLAEMPFLKQIPGLSREELTAKQENTGLTCLDNPKFWRLFDLIQERTEAHGNPLNLTKDDLLAPNRDGEPAITTAIHMGQTESVLRYLNERGDLITPNDLLEKDGDFKPLLQALLEEGDIAKLFTIENWQDQSRGALSRVYQALPEEAQQEIGNYHTLSATIGRWQSNAATAGLGA